MSNDLQSEIIRRFGELSPNRILRDIVERPGLYKEYTFVVLGRPGPTGKTWLTNGLREYGFKAIEISSDIACLVVYVNDHNYVISDHVGKNVTIVLNKRLN